MSTWIEVIVHVGPDTLSFKRSGVPDHRRSYSDRGAQRDLDEAATLLDDVARAVRSVADVKPRAGDPS